MSINRSLSQEKSSILSIKSEKIIEFCQSNREKLKNFANQIVLNYNNQDTSNFT